MTILLSNREIYEQVICGVVPQAKERLWIATADIKDMYVDAIAAERSEGRAKRGDSRGVSRVRGEGCATDGKAIVGIASATARCVELRLERAANPCRACPYTLREGPSPPPLLSGRIPGFPDEAALPPARRSAEVSVTTRNEEIKNDIGSPIRKDVQWRSCHPRPCGNAPSAHWRCDRLRQVGNCMNLRGEDDEPVTSIACVAAGFPRRWPTASDEIRKRIEFELSVFDACGRVAYCLMALGVADAIREAGGLVSHRHGFKWRNGGARRFF